MHGLTWGGNPLSTAVGLAVQDIIEREHVLDHVLTQEPLIAARLDAMRELPLVGDVRGAGHFWALELVKDKATRETFTEAECDWLLGDVLSGRMWEGGLLCRLDDRGDPVIQLSPPLVADMDLIDDMLAVISDALTVAGAQVAAGRTTA